mgnify:CR=1 FL=1
MPANYKAVTTQMTEEIFVSTFIIGKRTFGENNIRIAITIKKRSAQGVRVSPMYLRLCIYRDSVNRPVIDAGESADEREALNWQ